MKIIYLNRLGISMGAGTQSDDQPPMECAYITDGEAHVLFRLLFANVPHVLIYMEATALININPGKGSEVSHDKTN